MATPLSPPLSPLHGAREFVRQGFGARGSSCVRDLGREGVRASGIWGARELVRQGFGARGSSYARQVFGATLRTLKAAPSNSLAPRSGERAGERGRRSARTCAHGHTPLPCPLPASRGEGVCASGIWRAREFVRQGFGARRISCGGEGVRAKRLRGNGAREFFGNHCITRRERRGNRSCRDSEAEAAMPVRTNRQARSIPRYA